MRLVEHVRRRDVFRAPPFRVDKLVEDEEEPERIDRTGVEIVVAVFRIVEVEAAELFRMDEARDDHLDVHVRRMVAEVDEAEGPRSKRLRGKERRAPILDHGRIEGRLVHLVFEEEPPIRRQPGIDRRRQFEIALEGPGEMALAREVGAVADPNGQRLRAELFAERDAVEIVPDCLLAHGAIGVRERTELVGRGCVGSVG